MTAFQRIEQLEEQRLDALIEIFGLYKDEYKDVIGKRVLEASDEEFLKENRHNKIGYISIRDGENFLNIRINKDGKVVGRQDSVHGFDQVGESM